MSEEAEIHIDHRIYHDEPKIVLDIFELNDPMDGVPEKIEFSIHRMRSLKDNTLQEIRRPPPEYVNIWVKLEYGDWLCPVLFEEDGRPYIMAPAKKKDTEVQVYIREKRAERLLELLAVATDFCGKCSGPLDPRYGANGWLCYDSGGGAVADIYNCIFCEHENIRFTDEFIEDHPELELMAFSSTSF